MSMDQEQICKLEITKVRIVQRLAYSSQDLGA